MPANLATTNAKPTMMYAGDVPWHRLGARLKVPATAHEAMAACGERRSIGSHSALCDRQWRGSLEGSCRPGELRRGHRAIYSPGSRRRHEDPG
jgi:hypothetical protein